MRSISSIQEAQQVINELVNRLDTLSVKNWNRRQTRIVNAHPSVDPYDYVVRKELDALRGGGVGEVVSTGDHIITFGLNETVQATDKTPHAFVLASGIPKYAQINAKVAPTGSSFIVTFKQKETSSSDWVEILNPTNRLTVPIGSTWIHEIISFATALIEGSLLRIDVVQGDSNSVCSGVEVILVW